MEKDLVFELQDISKSFRSVEGKKNLALDHVSLELKRSVTYALIGESGSGKTTLGKMLAGLIRPSRGRILFDGQDLRRYRRDFFCQKVQIVFQNPYLSLDPKWRIQTILEEGIQEETKPARQQKIAEILSHILMPISCLDKYPQALSGGERQRIAIARSLLMGPGFLILDEPTSQLDTPTQAEIMVLLKRLKPFCKKGILFITHDIALASSFADEFIVMRHGGIVEQGPKKEILLSAQNSYTQEMLSSLPPWPPTLS